MPATPVMIIGFNHVDRIEDYKIAYRVFSERLGLTDKNKDVEHAS